MLSVQHVSVRFDGSHLQRPFSEYRAACDPPQSSLFWLRQPSLIQSSLKSMERLSTIDRIALMRSQDRKFWGNIRATLFVALNICLVFWNLLTKAAWKNLAARDFCQVVLFWLCQNSWNKPKTPLRILCSCHSLLEVTLSNRSGLPWTGRSAAVLATNVTLR